MSTILLKKIKNKTAVVGVVGLGYVGLPLAVEKAKAGFKVIGIDISKERIDMVNRGENYIGDVVDSDLYELVRQKQLLATDDVSVLSNVDCVTICVPTPLDDHYQPDISYVETSATKIAPYLNKNVLVILESTTYPGTTEEVLKPIFEQNGFICGKDFHLAFSPERVDPGNKKFNTKNTPKVVGGVTDKCTKVAAALYESVLEGEIIRVSSPAVAEMEKILENTYRNINIALINEMAILCDRMGIDIWEVVDAAKTKPYGFQAFYPGPGLGGHCIPIDPFYLTWKAREFDYHTRLIETSGEINNFMPAFVVEKASRILNDYKKPLNGAKVLVLGVAYKGDISDYRESPALRVINTLEKQMSDVVYYDPFVPEYRYKGEKRYGLKAISKEFVAEMDIVIITTAHSSDYVDYQLIKDNAKVIFDTKNILKDYKSRDNIILL